MLCCVVGSQNILYRGHERIQTGLELHIKTMNLLNNTRNNRSELIQILIKVKSGLYLVNFIFITTVSVLITKTVRENSKMKKEVRYFLLCHHLLCSSLFCLLGTVFNTMRTFQVQSLSIWIIFGLQAAIAESVLITLTLMALNIALAVCWPLRYLAFIHLVKHKIMACVWIVVTLKSACLIVIEYTTSGSEDIFEAEPSCPIFLGGNFAKVSGIILISLLAVIIITSYFFLCREGKLAGHFNRSSAKARKTIIFHGLQMSFHILPPLIIIAMGSQSQHVELKFGAFVVSSFAQSFSPVVYGLRSKDMQNKICFRPEGS
ncbi:uncharacterized protein LOC143843159 [Paroedura picta]|uniref:uncharacterized protein LOC143843159 n=1 Tax=Paroedura picta TaxID=143630 RepID=UPI004055FE8D